MSDERDEIRARVDIVALVGERLPLKRAGKAFKGLCPFHADKNPSFTVSPDTGRYKCWSCGEAGDVFTWVMKTQNVEFGEALEILAKRAGITLERRGPKRDPSVRQAHETAMEEALAFFREGLTRSREAQEYLERRGLSGAVADEWELGYALGGEALAVRLKRKGLSLAECKSLFLVEEDDRGGYYDKFRARLMFPIRNERGELVAFGGRLLGDGQPKYINSSDTPLYRKSRVLYGMHRARDHISKDRRAVLVEGYLDVIACHRAGVTNALASLGTALSEEHAKLLSRWCDEVVVLYDSDDAGRKAAERAVGVLEAEGVRVRVALMPQGDDPDTLLKNDGPAAVQRAVDAGVPPLDYALMSLERRLGPGQEEFWSEVTTLLAAAPTEMELDRHLVRLAPLYPGLRDPLQAQQALRRQIATLRRKPEGRAPAARPRPAATMAPRLALNSAESAVFRAFLTESFRKVGWMAAQNPELFTTGTAVELSDSVRAAFPDEPPTGKPAEWLHRIEPEAARQTLADLEFLAFAEPLTEAYLADTLELLKRRLERRRVAEMGRKEGLGDEDRQAIFSRLQRLKPDERAGAGEDDTLF